MTFQCLTIHPSRAFTDSNMQLDYLVQVKQAQSSLDEAEAARNLNNVIMLFTVVTIVFVSLA